MTAQVPAARFAFPSVVAHRGASAEAPENTHAAVRRAAEIGARAVEFDVKLAADDIAVVIHDDTVDRTTDARGAVAGYTADELAKLDAGSWFDPRFADQGVPPLTAILADLLDAGLTCNIELKPDPGTAAPTARAALTTAVAVWPDDLPPPLLSSFDMAALAVAREVRPDWPRAALFGRRGDVPDWLAAARDLECVAVHADQRRVDAAAIAAFHDAGFAAAVYTVNDPDRARDLWRDGLDYLFTDDPAALLPAAP